MNNSPSQEITLRWISKSSTVGVKFKYKTLAAARRKAAMLVTNKPKRDPDGYAVHPRWGHCLFFSGVDYKTLFPDADV